MKLTNTNMDDLLAKLLAAEASPEEEAAAADWLARSDDNRRYFEEFRRVWERAELARPMPSKDVDTEAALRAVKARLKRGGGRRVQMSSYRWMQAAAAVLLLGLATYLLWPSVAVPPMQLASANEPLTDTLHDGSVISLNRQSGVMMAEGFGQKHRRVQLSGEAYFEVVHDDRRPFEVEVRSLTIRDVGTKFNVDGSSDPDKVLITVTEGIVELDNGTQKWRVEAGQSAVYNTRTRQAALAAAASGTEAPTYLTRDFKFEATTLGEVVRQLSRVYGTDIVIKNKLLEDCPLTARYERLPLERVLELISETFPIKIEQQNGKIYFDGTACE